MILLSVSGGDSFFEFVVVLIVFVAILVITYYTTKWIAGYQKKSQGGSNLEVIETLKITTNKYVQIIRAGKNKYLIIGIGKDEVHMLGELTENELNELKNQSVNENTSFASMFRVLHTSMDSEESSWDGSTKDTSSRKASSPS